MTRRSRQRAAGGQEAFLASTIRDTKRLRKRLILAVALAPPKAKPQTGRLARPWERRR